MCSHHLCYSVDWMCYNSIRKTSICSMFTQEIMKLHHSTAVPSLHLLSGLLPAKATLHIKQYNKLRMVANLGVRNPLYRVALATLSTNAKFSQFTNLRNTSKMCNLPDPIVFLLVPPHKLAGKKFIKVKITEYWTLKFRIFRASAPPLDIFLTFFF